MLCREVPRSVRRIMNLVGALAAAAVAFHAGPVSRPVARPLVTRPTMMAVQEENGLDDEYPWRFDGRLWFRPALVRDTHHARTILPATCAAL